MRVLFLFSILILYTVPFICKGEMPSVKIGVLTDLSGKASFIGSCTQAGAAVAKDDLAETGVNLNLVIEDSTGDTRVAANAIQKLLLIDKVDALYVDTSPIAVAVSPIAASQKKILVYTGGAIAPSQQNTGIYKTHVDFLSGCRTIAEYWKRQGLKKVGISRLPIEASERCMEGAKSVFPGIVDTFHQTGEPLQAQALNLKSKAVEAVFSCAYEAGMLNLLKAMSDIGFHAPLGDLYSNLTPGITHKYPWLAGTMIGYGTKNLSEDFRRRLQEKMGAEVGPNAEFSAFAYTHLVQMARSIASCPKNDFGCQVSHTNTSPPDSTSGFKGWKGQIADIDLVLRKWNGKNWDVLH